MHAPFGYPPMNMRDSSRSSVGGAGSAGGYTGGYSGLNGPMVGVGLGLTLHAALPAMVVTEVAKWCKIKGGGLTRIEVVSVCRDAHGSTHTHTHTHTHTQVGDLLKSIDGWPLARDVDAVKKRLLGPQVTSTSTLNPNPKPKP